ncbi:MAG: phage tail spike protein [Clostridia bacterium]
MGYVYIYAPTADDLSTTGLCGALVPTSCEHEEIAGGMSAVTLVHPFDDLGRWQRIARGCILKCDCRVRTTPEIKDGQVVTSVERWTVKATATKAERGVFSKAVKGRRKATLAPGTGVIVVSKGVDRYKIKTGKVAGWIAHAGIDFVLAETTDDIESAAPPWTVRPQLFRISDVDIDTDAGTVTAYAPHITYDLAGAITTCKSDVPISALDALVGIVTSCDFGGEISIDTDIADTRTACDWTNVSPIEALLDPENGFLARWGAELVRDDYEMYFLRRAGRNRGTRIEYGKNLLGVNYRVSDEGVVTAIKPTGVKKDGSLLYLTDYDFALENYMLSPHAGEYPTTRAYVLACEDCTVDKKQITVSLARARMREQAQRMFDHDCDLPDVTLTVKFLQLGDTIEYAQYKDLEPVFLYDTVPVIDRAHGVEVQTDVHRIVWDCLMDKVVEVELGNVREGDPTIYSWQIQSLNGGKLTDGSVPGSALEDGALPPEKLDPDLQAALKKAWADIASAQALVESTRTWLGTVEATTKTIEAAVTDNQGAIAAVRIKADEIRAGLTDAEKNLAAVSLTAAQLQTAMTTANGDISTIRQDATQISSTVSNLSGSISAIQQDVGSISSTVGKLGGDVASLVTQTAEGVAVKLRNKSVNGNYEIQITSSPEYSHWGGSTKTCYGMHMIYNGTYYGGLFLDGFDSNMSSWNQSLVSPGLQRLISRGMADIICDDTAHPNAGIIQLRLDSDFSPGKRIRASEAITVDSDRRLKSDIAPIEHGEALFDALRPVQYHMRGSCCRSYGFIAQDVRDAMRALNIPETVLLSEPSDPATDYFALSYQELIALCVNKIQYQQAQIDTLDARLERLEAMCNGDAI